MEDETTETETPDQEEIVLTEEDDVSASAKIAGALLLGAAGVGIVTVGKKIVTFGRDKVATYKAGRVKETSTPESETDKSETEEK